MKNNIYRVTYLEWTGWVLGEPGTEKTIRVLGETQKEASRKVRDVLFEKFGAYIEITEIDFLGELDVP